MQKALHLMNLQLTQVLSDVTGVSGMAIIRAIVAGERRPAKLAKLRHGRCQRSEAKIAKAMTGNYRAEHLFALKQALVLYDAYSAQLAECDRDIETPLPPSSRVSTRMTPIPRWDRTPRPIPTPRMPPF